MKQLVYRKHGLMSNAKATFLLYVARYTMPCTIDLYFIQHSRYGFNCSHRERLLSIYCRRLRRLIEGSQYTFMSSPCIKLL